MVVSSIKFIRFNNNERSDRRSKSCSCSINFELETRTSVAAKQLRSQSYSLTDSDCKYFFEYYTVVNEDGIFPRGSQNPL